MSSDDVPPPLEAVPASSSSSSSSAPPQPQSMSERMAPYMEGPLRGFVRELARVIEAIGVKPGDKVADVGAGTGVVSEAFARAVTKQGAEGGAVYSLDISPFFLHGLRVRAERLASSADDPASVAAGKAIRVSPCGTTDLGKDIPDASLDLVFLADVLHHLPDRESTLRSVAAKLKPTGRAIILESDRTHYMENVARAHPKEFQSMLRENMANRAKQGAQGHGHSHGHAHGGGEAQGHGHSHGGGGGDHEHSHSHGHGHSHGSSSSASAAAASLPEGDLPLEEAVALARSIVQSIPPEDPVRLAALMRDVGLTHKEDLAGRVNISDVSIFMAFSRDQMTQVQ